MAELSRELLTILDSLTQDEFARFKWFLKLEGILEVHLEPADRTRTVDLMMEKYRGPGALKITMKILQDIGRNKLVERLQNYQRQRDELEEDLNTQFVNMAVDVETKREELERVRQFAVDVTLDPDTAHPDLVLSKDGKQVYDNDVTKDLPDSSKRFDTVVCVLGKEKFSTGIFYFEVLVEGKTAWSVGVVQESINRKGNNASPGDVLWSISLKNKVYEAIDNPSVCLSVNSRLQRVGVCVNYEDGLVSFYNVDTADLLYSFTDCQFKENLLPYFSPAGSENGTNSAPLIICPVINNTNKAELKRVQRFAVEVTLDPDTAHPNLILSDGKRVHHGDVREDLPDNPERFDCCVGVLGEQRFSSGKVYYEVQVEEKTMWIVGVATESIFRKGDLLIKPENGFWTVSFGKDDEYEANDTPEIRLHPRAHPQKVGVFLDYDEGLVSFYSVNTAERLYSFTGCCFPEKLLPFFCPCKNEDGSNSAPLIITPVNQFD